MVKGLFFILLFYFLGEVVSRLIGGYLPGSVIGMILLFLSLFFKIIQPNYVKDAATVITKNMALFFVPATIGLMVYTQYLSNSFWVIALAIVVSTILTIVVVALVQQGFENKKESVKSKNDE